MKACRIALLVALIGLPTRLMADDFSGSAGESWNSSADSLVPPPEPTPWVPGTGTPANPPSAYAAPVAAPALLPATPPPAWPRIDTSIETVVLPAPPPPPPAMLEWEVSSSWYVRADYFHWNEQIDGYDLLNEDGLLTTLGYARRIDRHKFLVELFGGDVHYSGAAVFDDGTTVPLSSHTEYLGARAEWDMRFALDSYSRTNFVAGLGTRVWLRNLPDALTADGDLVTGYQETWWTIYPYLGLEWSRPLGGGAELYGSARLGVTALTYQHATVDGSRTLSPMPGLTSQLEYGIRGSDLFLAGYMEAMSWGESPVVDGWLQPESTMLTVGIKAGLMF